MSILFIYNYFTTYNGTCLLKFHLEPRRSQQQVCRLNLKCKNAQLIWYKLPPCMVRNALGLEFGCTLTV